MRWTPGDRSSNLEDRRSSGVGKSLGVGGTVVVLVLSLVFGRDLFSDMGITPGQELSGASGQPFTAADSAKEEPLVQFVSFVLDDAQSTWRQTLESHNEGYRDAKLVLFRGAVESGCGRAQSAMGPFYCPADQKVYIDLGFYDELRDKFGAPGEFAQAYVLAHEVGHHIQNLLQTDARVRRLQQQNPDEANKLSVAMELQADCYAGVWAHSTQERHLLDPGDMEAGLRAASSVGDDRIQQQAGGGVNPESFTHGSAAQRASWFRRGYERGTVESCDTFGAGGVS